MEYDAYAGFVNLTENRAAEPLFTFGLLANTAYADLDHHRAGLDALKRAVEAYRLHKQPALAFVAHVGSVLSVANVQNQNQLASLAIYQDAVRRSDTTQWHVLPGAHDLRCLGADGVAMITPQAPAAAGEPRYYAITPVTGWRVAVLDAYDVSLIGHVAGSPEHTAAVALLAQHNPNPPGVADPLMGLVGAARRWSPHGGGLGTAQLQWLGAQLDAAEAAHESVIVLCHLNVLPAAGAAESLLYNYEEVATLLDSRAGIVAAWIAGAGADGSYARDEKGVHHIVPCSAAGCGVNEDAYGLVKVYADRLKLTMSGRPPAAGGGKWPDTDLYTTRSGTLVSSEGGGGLGAFGLYLVQMWLAVLSTLMTPLSPLLKLIGGDDDEGEAKAKSPEDDIV